MGRWPCIFFVFIASHAFAQGDGPRSYQLAPDGSRSLAAYGVFVRGNQSGDSSTVVQGAKVEAAGISLQYTQVLKAGTSQVQAFGVLPVGSLKATAPAPGGGTRSASSKGLGDASLGVFYGLIGSPALSDKDYAAYRPGFAMGALGKLSLPTGEYDRSSPVNLGGNRWSLQLGAPLVQYFGASFLDPSLTSFELTPSLQFFSANNAPPNAGTVKQDPFFKLEAHATRNISSSTWLSLDAFHVHGGETITDGTRDGNSQRWLNLGATAGFTFTDTVSATLTYGQVVRRNISGAEVHGLRAAAIIAF